MIVAISAILAANICAQEQKKECFAGKQMTKEERIEFDIKRLSHELMLSDKQAEKFAGTYREFATKLNEIFEKSFPAKQEPGKEFSEKELDQMVKQRLEGLKELASVKLKFYEKFRKDLSALQVERIIRMNEPFGPKPCCEKQCKKHDGPRPEGPRHEGPRPEGPRPEK